MIAAPAASQATPDEDLKSFKNYYHKKFPNTPKNDFINGVYSIDKASRAQWEEFEEFPSYEIFIDKGEELFNKKFANGKGYANCFPNHNKGIKQNYPYFDTKSGEVVTLEGAINKCRTDNGEKALGWKKGKMTHLGAYLTSKSRAGPGREHPRPVRCSYQNDTGRLDTITRQLPVENRRPKNLSFVFSKIHLHQPGGPSWHRLCSYPGAGQRGPHGKMTQ